MKPFHKRTFRGPGQFLAEAGYLLRRAWAVARLLRGNGLESGLRERLFLAVTQVNQCRTCAWAHTRIALGEGVAADEVRALLRRDLEATPEAEREAVLYAQHWADTDGRPDAEAVSRLAIRYDADTLDRIHLALRFIRFSNYLGNLTEYLVFRITFGRLGDAGGGPKAPGGAAPDELP